MARRCDISGVTHQNGNRVSHANNKTHHKFDSNLQVKLGFLETLKKHKISLADISK